SARFFVVEKSGFVRIAGGGTFIDVHTRVNSGPDEAGLLGMAFHPDWQTNRQAFLSYTAYSSASPANLRSTISRFVSRDGGATLDPASEQVLLTLQQPYENHNGGNIVFGPDGFLYIGFGDGGLFGDPGNYAQNLSAYLGKILRMNADTGAAPADNPFAPSLIWAYGLRNPWRFSFDRATGDLWAGDVGQDTVEEIDMLPATDDGRGAGRAANLGWSDVEGDRPFDGRDAPEGAVAPLHTYGRDRGCS